MNYPKIRHLLLIIIVNYSLSIIHCSHAQNQYNIWYFGAGRDAPFFGSFAGRGAGLDFNSGSPVADTNSAMSFTEGCTIQCDSAGNLLFYATGDTVWDRSHNIMPNGIGLSDTSAFSSLEGCVSVPIQGSSTKYLLFTNAGNPTGGGTGLFYSIIDMTLNGGLGDVTATKKVLLLPNTYEKLAVVRHANNFDFWVITAIYQTNTYYAYLISDSNIIDTVISSVGPIAWGVSHLKASPARDKLATFVGVGDTIVLYDFNNSTGVICNPITIADTTIGVSGWFGLSFSPDGKLFYATGGTSAPFNDVYQFDVTAPSIPASSIWVGTASSVSGTDFVFDMQIGPDGKIYVAMIDYFDTLNLLDAIDSPNVRGVGCNYVNAAVDLAGRICWLSLPNLITDYLNPPLNNSLTAGFFYTDICFSDSTSFIDTSQGNPDGWFWDFGDGGTSSEQNPKHQYSVPGTYPVMLIIFQSCYTDTFSQFITIDSLPFVDAGKDTALCEGDSIVLNATITGAISYIWNPATGLNDTNLAKPIASPTITTTYVLTVSDTNNCESSDSVIVSVDICTKNTFFIPNSFSPNGDDINDVLFVRGSGLKSIKLYIYNRWGEKVYQLSVNKGWDGTYRGKPLNPAVFAWYAEVEFEDGNRIYKKGNITLIR